MAPRRRDHMIKAYFRRTNEGFEPLELAHSDWNWAHLHGVSVSGLLACGAEDALRGLDREHFVPARFHVDLSRPTRAAFTTVASEVVRSSSRLTQIDVRLHQSGNVAARGSALFLRPSENPDGDIWTPSDRGAPPPLSIAPASEEPRPPYIGSDQPWSARFGDHQNAGRHQTWHTAVPIIIDEPMSTFQGVAALADTASMVANWGSAGIGYINTDVSLTLARRPVGMEIGLRTLDHVQHQGVAVAAVEVYDRCGPLGNASITALANTRRALDYSAHERAEAQTLTAEHTTGEASGRRAPGAMPQP